MIKYVLGMLVIVGMGMVSSGEAAGEEREMLSFKPCSFEIPSCQCLEGGGATGENPEADKRERLLLGHLHDFLLSSDDSIQASDASRQHNKDILSKIMGVLVYEEVQNDGDIYYTTLKRMINKNLENYNLYMEESLYDFWVNSLPYRASGGTFLFYLYSNYRNHACLTFDEIASVFGTAGSCDSFPSYRYRSSDRFVYSDVDPSVAYYFNKKERRGRVVFNFHRNDMDLDGNSIGTCVRTIAIYNN